MRRVILVTLLLLFLPSVAAEDSDGDGYEDPTAEFSVWDGADAYPNNPDIQDPVFSSGCDPPVATLDLGEPVTFTCTVANEGPVDLNVLIDVEDDTHLANRFQANYYDIATNEVLTLRVTMEGLSEGVAMAQLRIFGRANESAHDRVDLPVEVTGDTWVGLNSHSEGTPAPDVSWLAAIIDDVATALSDNTPWEFDRGRAGVVIMISVGLMLGAIRVTRARKVWGRNMTSRGAKVAARDARFDSMRSRTTHAHHEDTSIPESPKARISKDEADYIPKRLRK
jgi:hypothetical protein